MATILAHGRIRPHKLRQFESIERDIAAGTHSGEPDCLRYECWRASEPNNYYVLLSFRDASGFYTHQVADWHEKHVPGLYECFDSFKLEFVDPVPGARAGLSATRKQPLPDDASRAIRDYTQQFPVVEQDWWRHDGR